MDVAVGIVKSALTFIAVLSVLILVHEWGHFILAKLCGMRVEDFSLFFGKRLIRLGVRNGTEYNIRSIPLGGYVRIAGMEPDDISNGVPIFSRAGAKKNAATLHGLSEEAMAEIDFEKVSDRIQHSVETAVSSDGVLTGNGRAELKSLLASTGINEDEHRYLEAVIAADSYVPDPQNYNQKPLWQRAATIFAGPFMSIFFGYALFCIMGFTYGLPDDERIENVVDQVVAGKPADKAGLKSGDRIVQIDNQKISDGKTMIDLIHQGVGKTLQVHVQRSNANLVFSVKPYSFTETVVENGKTVKHEIGRLGFAPKGDLIWKRYQPVEAVNKGTQILVNYIRTILSTLFSKHVSENIGGPIAVADEIHQARNKGPMYVVIIAGMISIGLGVFNLFPIPILDGGHLLLLAIEGIRRRKLSSREIYTAQLFGLSIIGVIFVFVMFHDIIRLLPHSGP